MKLFNNRISFYVMLAFAAILNSIAVSTTDADDRPVIEMKLQVVDAGFNVLPENRFVQGEEILVMVKLQNCTALNQKAEHDQEMARSAKNGNQSANAVTDVVVAPVMIGSGARPWTDDVEFYWATPGQSENKIEGAVRTNLDFKDNRLGRGEPKQGLAFEQTEFWSVPTTESEAGDKSLVARFMIPDNSIPDEKALLEQSVAFTVIDRNAASQTDLARITSYIARDALNEGRYQDAIVASREAIGYGTASKIDESTLYEVVGEAFENLGRLDSALTAYERVLELAEQYFPGRSSTEARMEPKIHRLRKQIGDQER